MSQINVLVGISVLLVKNIWLKECLLVENWQGYFPGTHSKRTEKTEFAKREKDEKTQFFSGQNSIKRSLQFQKKIPGLL